ncbi:MAG: Rieske 2Fe-2S domain-containing protein [Anaerolineae bacterium]|nr:Rieske 2Fe-2S domain-containing protein [Anaerolineae bacterium]
MYKNFWWPLATSNEVSNKPMRVTALQQEFVLYRLSNGQAQVLSDLCVHRGGALSDGWLSGECIVCPYHGWAFTRDGACVKIPANQDGVPVPRKARVDSYPTVEKYGFVWAFLGDLSEQDRVPLAALAGVAERAQGASGSITWQASYDKVVAHLGDLAKAFFAIDAEFAGPQAKVGAADTSQSDWSIKIAGNITPPPSIEKGFWGLTRKEVASVATNASMTLHFPCITAHQAGGGQLVLIHLPVNDKVTQTKWLAIHPQTTLPETSNRRLNAALEAMRDQIEGGAAPTNIAAQAFARMCNEALQRGWGIDIHTIQSDYANIKAVVIPSPARREVPELAAAWVLKEVPVLRTD